MFIVYIKVILYIPFESEREILNKWVADSLSCWIFSLLSVYFNLSLFSAEAFGFQVRADVVSVNIRCLLIVV